MSDRNKDTPTSPMNNAPTYIGDAELIGVDTRGTPLYFDEEDGRAFEGREADGSWEEGEHRESGPIADIVSRIGDATGWDTLSEYGRENHDESNRE